jgi:type 1 glutamine amidotransferase
MRKSNGTHVWVVEIDQRAGRDWEPMPQYTYPTRESCRWAARGLRRVVRKNDYRAALYVHVSADAARQVGKR